MCNLYLYQLLDTIKSEINFVADTKTTQTHAHDDNNNNNKLDYTNDDNNNNNKLD